MLHVFKTRIIPLLFGLDRDTPGNSWLLHFSPARPPRVYKPADLPKFWAPMDTISPGYDLVPLDTTDASYKEVRTRFFQTMKQDQYSIQEIYRVQNPQLWKEYERYFRLSSPSKNFFKRKFL